MDKLRAMAHFVSIVDQGSLTAAAMDEGVSLPAMVRTLAGLERELGATLLNRTTRRLHLTDDGRAYLDHCRLILGEVAAAEAALRSRHAEPAGKLTVTASVLFGRTFVAPLMSEFVRRHAAVTAELVFVDRIVNLVEEGMDAAIRIGPIRDSSLVAIPLGKVRRVVCASPDYLDAHGTPAVPADIQGHRSVRFTGLSPRGEWSFRVNTRRVAVPMSAALICNHADAAIEACADGLGLGAFLSYMVASHRRAGTLRYVLEKFETEALPVQLVYPQTRLLSPTVRALIDLCVTRLRETDFG